MPWHGLGARLCPGPQPQKEGGQVRKLWPTCMNYSEVLPCWEGLSITFSTFSMRKHNIQGLVHVLDPSVCSEPSNLSGGGCFKLHFVEGQNFQTCRVWTGFVLYWLAKNREPHQHLLKGKADKCLCCTSEIPFGEMLEISWFCCSYLLRSNLIT